MESYSKYDKQYKRKIKAGSIIFIRPLSELEKTKCSSDNDFDYKVLLLKRNPRIVFGGFYAFPGGKVEEQDLYENWIKEYPEMFKNQSRIYYDFNERICAIRETFEEINILIAK